jgi:hypothetical protein
VPIAGIAFLAPPEDEQRANQRLQGKRCGKFCRAWHLGHERLRQ